VAKIKPLTLNFKALGAWKYVKVASLLRTEKPAQKHILLTLAFYADPAGYCHPSYESLMDDTGYGSKQTIAEALTYLRDDLKILTWTKGHSNQYRPNIANGYTLILQAMVKVLKAQRDARRATEEAEALSTVSVPS